MKSQRIMLGQKGEELAVTYLRDHGYRIIERNFQNKFGEIDIIATDKETLCFIEVKTRRTQAFGTPFEAITPYKRRKLICLAEIYLQEKEIEALSIRFDCVAVYMPSHKNTQIELMKGAFERP